MKNQNHKKKGLSLITTIILIIASFMCLFPLFIALVNSFKTNGEMFNNILKLPKTLNFENYTETFDKMNYFSSLINNIVITLIGVGGIIIVSSMAGWKICRTKTKLSKVIYGLFVFAMLIPFNSVMIPLYRIANVLNLNNSTYGLGIIYIGLGVSMAIFLYSGFTKTIPIELEEAAKIDGCGQIGIYYKIVIPLLKPITMTIAIMNVLWVWNDFQLPLIMLQNSKNYTLVLSTNMLFGQYNSDWTAILSALIMAAIPVVIFYAFFQKYILQGITDGSVKG
ncbi:MAG: carbohydrate ABC transporter permease [Clostridiaceae bacterium]